MAKKNNQEGQRGLFGTKFLLAVLALAIIAVAFFLGKLSEEWFIGGIGFVITEQAGLNAILTLMFRKSNNNKEVK